jgi:hypothetical protein
MRPRHLHHVYCLALALSALLPSHASAAEEPSPLEKEKENLGKLMPLYTKGGRLGLDREAWKQVPLTKQEVEDYGSIAKNFIELVIFWRIIGALGEGQVGHFGSYYWQFKTNNFEANISGSIQGTLDFSIAEKVRPKRKLTLAYKYECELSLRLEISESKQLCDLRQEKNGHIFLDLTRDGKRTSYEAPTFDALLKQAPDQIQLGFIRPLAEIGIQMPTTPYLPVVMARATSGYADAAPEIGAQVAADIRKLSLDDADARDAATLALIKLFPLAVKQIADAEAAMPDQEAKLRLQRVIAAHPGIAKFKTYVETEKLQDNKAYLLDLFANVKFFKQSAHQRLIALYGNDYGDDPANWPKP